MGKIVKLQLDFNFNQFSEQIRALVDQFSHLLTVEIIGYSVEKRPIYALRLGRGKKGKLMFSGAHHAREWLTTVLLMDMIEMLCENETKNSQTRLLDDITFWFIPMVNPDGVTLVQEGPTGFSNEEDLMRWNFDRTGFQAWKANSRGVDLNRQYPADWDTIRSDPGEPSPSHYKGSKPVSEPEVKAVYDFILKNRFDLTVAYHSSGEEIYWKYKSKGKLAKKAKYLAEKIHCQTGYEMIDPGENPSGGGLTDWFLSCIQKPGFTIEIAPYVGPRPVPLYFYQKIWLENKEIPVLLANEYLKMTDK